MCFSFRSLQESGRFINQFPNECSLTCKDLLASVCQNANPPESGKEDDLLRRGPEWLPVTFNLTFELPLFVDHYLKRKDRYQDIKEWFTVSRLNHKAQDSILWMQFNGLVGRTSYHEAFYSWGLDCSCLILHKISNTRVFHQDFQTPRNEVKKWDAAELFLAHFNYLNTWWNILSSVWY